MKNTYLTILFNHKCMINFKSYPISLINKYINISIYISIFDKFKNINFHRILWPEVKCTASFFFIVYKTPVLSKEYVHIWIPQNLNTCQDSLQLCVGFVVLRCPQNFILILLPCQIWQNSRFYSRKHRDKLPVKNEK